MSTAYSPPGLDKEDRERERTTLIGNYLLCVSYGMEVILYIITSQLLLSRRSRVKHARHIFIYITLLFVLATIATGCALDTLTWEWVDNRDYPGGPVAFSYVDGKNPVYLTMLMAYNLMSVLQDGWLLYRFLLIWNRNWIIFVIPFLLFLSSTGTSFLMWAQILISGAPFLASSHVNLGFITWLLTISTNLLLTTLIVLRIFLVRLQAIGEVGKSNIRPFMSVASILVESQAIYAAVGVLVLVGLKRNEGLVNVWANTFGIMEAFAPTLVAYRVAKGTAWSFHHYQHPAGTLSTFNPASFFSSFFPGHSKPCHSVNVIHNPNEVVRSSGLGVDPERGVDVVPTISRDTSETTSPTAYAPSTQSMVIIPERDKDIRDGTSSNGHGQGDHQAKSMGLTIQKVQGEL